MSSDAVMQENIPRKSSVERIGMMDELWNKDANTLKIIRQQIDWDNWVSLVGDDGGINIHLSNEIEAELEMFLS